MLADTLSHLQLQARACVDESADRGRSVGEISRTAVNPAATLLNHRDSELSVEIARSVPHLDAIKTQWLKLEAEAGEHTTCFQSFAWCRACVAENPQEAHIVTVWDSSELVLVWPLAVTQTLGLRTAKWLGDPLTQFGDMLLSTTSPRSAVAIQVAYDAIGTALRVDTLNLTKVRADSAILAAGILPDTAVERIQETAILEFGQFDDLDAYLKILSKSQSANRRGRRKKLSAIGELTFHVAKDARERAEITQHAVDWKLAWLEEHDLTSRASLMAQPYAVMEAAVANSGDGTEAVVSHLALDGQPIAVEVGFLTNGLYYAYLGAFAPEHAKLSPGALQMEETLGWLKDRGVKSYDLFAPMDAYKTKWTNCRVEVRDYSVAMTAKGRLKSAVIDQGLMPGLRSIYRSCPKSVQMFAAKATKVMIAREK